MTGWFTRFADWSAYAIGSAYAFACTCATTLMWLTLGYWVNWSDTWQITWTTILTITTQLTAQLIQHTQQRQERALHKKIDEVIRALPQADNRLRGIETVCGEGDADER